MMCTETVQKNVEKELEQVHKMAVDACRKFYQGDYDNAIRNKQIVMELHYESVILELKKN